MLRLARVVASAMACAAMAAFAAGQPEGAGAAPPGIRIFFEAASTDASVATPALEALAAGWRDGYAGMIVDLARFMRSPRRARPSDAAEAAGAPDDALGGADGLRGGAGSGFPPHAAPPDPTSLVRVRLTRFLEKRTGQRFGDDLGAWRRWIWSRPYEPHPDLAAFKATLYAAVDPRMAEFFSAAEGAAIRLDEIDWGGVGVNGIPPLDHPGVVAAADASWLDDKHVVFGLALGGEARAYPKRILAWHELARDRLGGVELSIVYCTLCGTVVPYESLAGGVVRRFGTSGLLYRSNKLLFDEESKSLWSTADGRPVVGPLAGSGLELAAHPVVTTTWGEWRRRHPETTVLGIETGFRRDYREGAAYRDYFGTQRLMFEIPRSDGRLKNKDEVLALLLRPPGAGELAPRQALALDLAFLRKRPLHQRRFAGRDLVILTSRSGANRVYESSLAFSSFDGDEALVDRQGGRWRVTEKELVPPEGSGSPAAPRLPARRAFWFGWHAQFPDTELVRE
ncbi:MAG: DUF3179 domain-containing protein [Vicinamibacteria bacterium]